MNAVVTTTARLAERDLDLPRPARSSWPEFEADEIAAVTEILRSGKVNSLHHGQHCAALEQGMAALCEVPYGIAVANGTLALELALHALGIGEGDEVIVPARSFMASASCVIARGAKPVFADVDSDSQNITAETIEQALTPKTKAVVVVHLAGWPCEMAPIMELARAKGFFVVEDCAQAHGARIDGRPVGSFGEASAFSFCTDKIISTGGEGGMLVLKDRAHWKTAWAYKDHGKDPEHYASIVPGPDFLWLHDSFGSNFRLTEMQAAIGNLQLAKLPQRIAARQRNAMALEAELASNPAIRLMQPRNGVEHARYKYYAAVRPDRLQPGIARRDIVQQAGAAGLSCSVGSCPEIYREPAFDSSPSRPAEHLPVAHQLGETTIMLPVDHTLSVEDARAAGAILNQIVSAAAQ
ncbi:DegT/DnrJ/EryC1/StrS family aminotransferase [Aurantiacibacter poecillastricola]|uniref:DegT/DnrJ/EryC1/StrS family aminotransferase n=1 Tax=Aurantiacibacter poecillastricola TaxID=3064385 RepID=UPI00273E5DAA|nr:DegT/DnrJ/EryC1/StrS family aminotransferase [Aurantiacibacter sp. 219JJ12-13]MDP5259996.1 DegT/DnrJ/EryC1/StrS family aminotransferase [Aurantiacibacter sp. 219JJ12-13]